MNVFFDGDFLNEMYRIGDFEDHKYTYSHPYIRFNFARNKDEYAVIGLTVKFYVHRKRNGEELPNSRLIGHIYNIYYDYKTMKYRNINLTTKRTTFGFKLNDDDIYLDFPILFLIKEKPFLRKICYEYNYLIRFIIKNEGIEYTKELFKNVKNVEETKSIINEYIKNKYDLNIEAFLSKYNISDFKYFIKLSEKNRRIIAKYIDDINNRIAFPCYPFKIRYIKLINKLIQEFKNKYEIRKIPLISIYVHDYKIIKEIINNNKLTPFEKFVFMYNNHRTQQTNIKLIRYVNSDFVKYKFEGQNYCYYSNRECNYVISYDEMLKYYTLYYIKDGVMHITHRTRHNLYDILKRKDIKNNIKNVDFIAKIINNPQDHLLKNINKFEDFEEFKNYCMLESRF
jgi:hypothetical protein